MNIHDYLRSNGLTVESVLEKNLTRLVPLLEQAFDTKVLEYGVVDLSRQQGELHLPLSFMPPRSATFMCYLYIPIDDYDNIVTNSYYDLVKRVDDLDLNDPLDSFSAQQFGLSLRQDTDICSFINSQFKGGNIYNIGSFNISKQYPEIKKVKNIEKIEDVRYRQFFYFSDNNLTTL